MKFVVFTLGCKVNIYEGQAMISRLESKGFDATDKLVPADYYIINTCSVTGEADRKSRQTISRVKRLNPKARIYVCGCSSQNDGDIYAEKDGVKIVGGVADKMSFIDKIVEDVGNAESSGMLADDVRASELPSVYEDNLFPAHTRTRGLIKIQDGCNRFCSYCIIPYLRGRSRSRSIESIVSEAEKAAEITREIVLTGVDISAFGLDTGESFTGLIKALGGVKARKRIGSLECSVITREFLDAMAENGFCAHFHLSMQSGSKGVLEKMNRRYTPEEFIGKVELIREIMPFAGITTDIIAGFPTETEAQHRETLETVERIRFSDAHIFPYSERKGTRAARLPQVDKSVRIRRAAELSELRDKHKTEFLIKNSGTVREVYLEEKDGEYNVGYTDNYIKVYSTAEEKTCTKHILKEIYKDGIKGEKIYE